MKYLNYKAQICLIMKLNPCKIKINSPNQTPLKWKSVGNGHGFGIT